VLALAEPTTEAQSHINKKVPMCWLDSVSSSVFQVESQLELKRGDRGGQLKRIVGTP